MAKITPLPYRIGDLEVRIRSMVWLPAAGLTFEHIPEALEEMMSLLPGHPGLEIVKSLPVLEPLTHEEVVEESDLCAALEGTEGFIFLMETPKRRFFSDGSQRMNWSDTYHQWAYSPDVAGIEAILTRYVEQVVEDDGRKYPRIEPQDEA